MIISVPKERAHKERRVALTPDACDTLVKGGFTILVEEGAGMAAFFDDDAYRHAGAAIASASDVFAQGDIVVKVGKPDINPVLGSHEVDAMHEEAILIAFLNINCAVDLLERLVQRRITSISMERIPRLSRAQTMDALTSQATISGYKAAILAAEFLPRYFPMLMLISGTLAPAKVLVLGAGVAGLQAIATARRLGAMVWGYDVRTAAADQVRSLGAKFLELDVGVEDVETAGGYAKTLPEEARRRQREALGERIREFDVVITTAQIPGLPAPLLITGETVWSMRPGSVIIDLAAESGGNCQLTNVEETVVVNGVTIHGPTNLPSTMATHASQTYAGNIMALIGHLIRNGKPVLDFNDEILRAVCLTHDGRILQP
ncbi:MAG: NAD(P) transhydrogenase subunit alpha part 1 [Syntrophus sp. SKADARSKE-3]|nr:NAD(P) transhydrogenase subunit alpha part 1 [Syntrophus sp. SKADARSKE-3]